MKRLESADSITDVMERIVDRGIVVDPWVGLRLTEPQSLRNYRWVAECHVLAQPRCQLRKAS